MESQQKMVQMFVTIVPLLAAVLDSALVMDCVGTVVKLTVMTEQQRILLQLIFLHVVIVRQASTKGEINIV